MTAYPSPEPIEISELGEIDNLVARIFGGEVFIMRQGLQKVGLFDELVKASLDGIRRSVGKEVATNAECEGFDRIHEWVEPGDVPRMTGAVYEVMEQRVHTMMKRFVTEVFPGERGYYYEKSPNVRFHIPFGMTLGERKSFNDFAGTHGDGKITAHAPHRDSWVDCPANVVNLWIAIGPVSHRNGLTIYAKDYGRKVSFENGYIASSQSLHEPMTFDLAPGDAILFHSDHIHGSQLNVTDSTRFVVSNRITFGKPQFLYGHHHHYVHAGMAGGPFRWLSRVPANMQMSWVRDKFRRLFRKIGLVQSGGSDQASSGNEGDAKTEDAGAERGATEDSAIALASFSVGEIRAQSKTVCVARLGENEFAAVSRRCPHAGGDLAGGWVAKGRPVCPLHNLSFDPNTGVSACSGLVPLKTFSFEIRGDHLYVNASSST